MGRWRHREGAVAVQRPRQKGWAQEEEGSTKGAWKEWGQEEEDSTARRCNSNSSEDGSVPQRAQ